MYETCVDSLVKSCFEGYNATVFAYGQTVSIRKHMAPLSASKCYFVYFLYKTSLCTFTLLTHTHIDIRVLFIRLLQGSGKTYTVGGGNIATQTEEDFGIIPRAVKYIYDHIQVGVCVYISLLEKSYI